MAAMKKKILSGESGPKKVVSDLSTMVGGVLSAKDPCELPRNEQQVSDMKQRQKKFVIAGTVSSSDEIAVVMHKAYLEDSNQQFIREVKTLREPAIVVAIDRQLNDVVRFCTNEDFRVLTVDPTFSLGDFDVTVTPHIDTYYLNADVQRNTRHSLVLSWCISKNHYPHTISSVPHLLVFVQSSLH